MTPCLFHVPPPASRASQSTSGAPPDASTLFSFPSAKKPSLRPSGDQKGQQAPSVPERGRSEEALSVRTQRRLSLPAVEATNANSRPSGERAGGPAPKSNAEVAGGSSEATTGGEDRSEERRVGKEC